MRAWHFLADDGILRDGRPAPPDGEWLVHTGRLIMCESGLHCSPRAIDALKYAPGSLVCRVEVRGERLEDVDKWCCRERRIIWRADATETLREFARLCALDVIDQWNAPEVVVRYLRTGDESIRYTAQAAGSAAWSAACSAGSAAEAACSAGSAAEAAWSAACSAVGAARYAAAAARSAVGAARYAAAAARSAAAPAWDTQNWRLTRMLCALHRSTT